MQNILEIFNREEPSYYCGDELHRIKQDKIKKAMQRHGLDALLIFKSEAIRYITDFYAKGYRPFLDLEYVLLVTGDLKTTLGYSSGSDEFRLKIRSDIKNTRKLPSLSQWHRVILEMLKENKLEKAVIGTDLLPFSMGEGIKKECPEVIFKDIEEIWTELTVVKHPIEIDLLRKSLALVDKGLNAAAEYVKPGIREWEVAAYAEYIIRKEGSEFSPFIPILSSGPNTSLFERIHTEKIIREGELVIMDLGSVYKGYTGDGGRTVIVGKPLQKQKRIFKACHRALHAAIEIIRPGITCEEIDQTARRVIEEEGFGEYQHRFSTGHQLGYGLHGNPSINKGVKFEVLPNMVMALEPRITLYDDPKVGGIHLEDAVLVTETGHEILSHSRYDERLME